MEENYTKDSSVPAKNGTFTERKKKFEKRGLWNEQIIQRKKEQADSLDKAVHEVSKKLSNLEGVSVVSVKAFDHLPISKLTLRGLADGGFRVPTPIQQETLIHSLWGKDVVGEAKTGSGKTLAFLIPLLELLYQKKWSQWDGLGAVIITPTRELAYQIFEVLNVIGSHHSFSAGIITGGIFLSKEWDRIYACNILISTPGRLLHHMTENPAFEYSNLQILVLDEADKILSMGFAETVDSILQELPKSRQTLLFSATQTRKVEDLIRAGCKDPVYCYAAQDIARVTPTSLRERYVVLEDHEKFMFLWSFIKHHLHVKCIIFVSTCNQVTHYTDMIERLDKRISLLHLHGGLNQKRRFEIYDQFCQASQGILICTDIAARGLDIPRVDWVIQLDCPEDATTYIHRAGRTARNDLYGESLLILTSSQAEPMLSNLKARGIELENMEIVEGMLHVVPKTLNTIVAQHPEKKERAQRVFKGYLKTVMLMKDKKVFDVLKINLDALARSLGLAVTPRVRAMEKYCKLKGVDIQRKSTGEGSCSYTLGSDADKSIEANNLKTFNFHLDIVDDCKELFIKPVNEGYYKELEEASRVQEEAALYHKKSKLKQKFVTKYDIARSLLHKKLVVNEKVLFDEDGNPLEKPNKNALTIGEKEDFKTGIDVDKFKALIDAEDLATRALAKQMKHEERMRKREEKKEMRQQRREEAYELLDPQTKAYIDELPDPDKIYGECESDDEAGDKDRRGGSSEDDDSESDKDATEDHVDDSGDNEKFYNAPVSEEENENEWNEDIECSLVGKRKLKSEAYSRQKLKKTRKMEEHESECGMAHLVMEEKERLALYLLGEKD